MATCFICNKKITTCSNCGRELNEIINNEIDNWYCSDGEFHTCSVDCSLNLHEIQPCKSHADIEDSLQGTCLKYEQGKCPHYQKTDVKDGGA